MSTRRERETMNATLTPTTPIWEQAPTSIKDRNRKGEALFREIIRLLGKDDLPDEVGESFYGRLAACDKLTKANGQGRYSVSAYRSWFGRKGKISESGVRRWQSDNVSLQELNCSMLWELPSFSDAKSRGSSKGPKVSGGVELEVTHPKECSKYLDVNEVHRAHVRWDKGVVSVGAKHTFTNVSVSSADDSLMLEISLKEAAPAELNTTVAESLGSTDDPYAEGTTKYKFCVDTANEGEQVTRIQHSLKLVVADASIKWEHDGVCVSLKFVAK